MQVKDLMKQAHIIHKDISLQEAARIMSSEGISSLLYVPKDKLSGIITERDLLKNFNKQGVISKIMTKKVITISSEEDIHTALDMMRNYNKKKLPVVEKGKLIGVLNLVDIASNSDEIGEGFFFN